MRAFSLELQFGATRSGTQIPFGNDNNSRYNKSRFGGGGREDFILSENILIYGDVLEAEAIEKGGDGGTGVFAGGVEDAVG